MLWGVKWLRNKLLGIRNNYLLASKFNGIRILSPGFRKHVKEKHFHRVLACNECDYECRMANELKLHKENMHLGIR